MKKKLRLLAVLLVSVAIFDAIFLAAVWLIDWVIREVTIMEYFSFSVVGGFVIVALVLLGITYLGVFMVISALREMVNKPR